MFAKINDDSNQILLQAYFHSVVSLIVYAVSG